MNPLPITPDVQDIMRQHCLDVLIAHTEPDGVIPRPQRCYSEISALIAGELGACGIPSSACRVLLTAEFGEETINGHEVKIKFSPEQPWTTICRRSMVEYRNSP